jgi:two-component system sensor histidine kinase BaeS
MNLNMLVELTVEGFQALAAEKEVILHYTPDTQPLVARIDQTRIQQVLNNLINNALQYTPTGGQVWVTLSQAYIKNRHAAVIQVQDTGVGISEEDLPHIFERFYRGRIPQDLQIPGTGLGLAIVKEIIQQHGGWVDVESTVGHGSWFTIYLPLDPGAP